MSPSRSLIAASKDGFPRVSGDEPLADAEARLAQMFSPRERG